MAIDLFQEAQKIIRKSRDRLRRLSGLLKEIESCAAHPDENAFIFRDRLRALEHLLGDTTRPDELAPLLSRLSNDLSPRSEEAMKRAKAAVGSSLASLLAEEGLDLQGNFPHLSCGLLSLEFSFDSGGKTVIYFGPRIEMLKQVSIHPESIARAVVEIYKVLDGTGFDEEAHIETLFQAYQNVLKLTGRQDGTDVPITQVMLQTAIVKQDTRFLTNPTRSRFSSYGLVQFSYDLSRTRNRITRDHRLHLTVASMEQTRRSTSHLWVPQGPRARNGTHYSTMSFHRIDS
jgi:hypothetical protein